MAETAAGLLLSDDLLFASRITGTARALGLTLRAARTPADLEALARAEAPRCVVLDLANPGLALDATVRTLRLIRSAASPRDSVCWRAWRATKPALLVLSVMFFLTRRRIPVPR